MPYLDTLTRPAPATLPSASTFVPNRPHTGSAADVQTCAAALSALTLQMRAEGFHVACSYRGLMYFDRYPQTRTFAYDGDNFVEVTRW
jgi:hypothetical protein